MRVGSDWNGEHRRAAYVEGDRAFVASDLSLEDVISSGSDLRKVKGEWTSVGRVNFDVPLRPPVVLCTGHNYDDHYAEKSVNRANEAKGLEFFLKAGQTIAGLDAPLRLDPIVTRKLDQETELGIVIGKGGRHIPREKALEHVFGYLVVNDITARDRQITRKADGSFVMELGTAKNFDGATRFSQFIVTADEIGDPQTLELFTLVNGARRQLNNTANMIHGVAEIISFFSSVLTLEPGTVIATGTPAGSGWGQDTELGGKQVTPPGCVPAAYLSPGDTVVNAIARLGEIRFDVVGA